MSEGEITRIKPNTPNGNPAWEKGKSANPGGRPKTVKEVREFAGQYTVEALEVALKIMRDEKVPAKIRLVAGSILLDRALGRPAQMISGDPDGVPLTFRIVKLAGATEEQLEIYRRSDGEHDQPFDAQ